MQDTINYSPLTPQDTIKYFYLESWASKSSTVLADLIEILYSSRATFNFLTMEVEFTINSISSGLEYSLGKLHEYYTM